MKGILGIAYKLLVNDRAKFFALLIGISFSTFLMTQMTATFSGVIRRASSTVTNVGAPMWVIDPAVNNPLNSIPLPDYVLDAVRSVRGVKYAVPLYSGTALVRLASGDYQPASIIGLDDSSLYGRPEMIEGRIEDIYAENGFIAIVDPELAKLESPHVGTVFEVNDHRGKIVGLGKVPSSGLFGIPTLFTTYTRAIQYLPTGRFTTSYVLVVPEDNASIESIQADIKKLGYDAPTEKQFAGRIVAFYTWKTGFGMSLVLMTAISFVVGLSISGQTFYSFTIENLEKFGALKAIGAKRRALVAMLLFQSGLTAFAGYGLGVGGAALFIAIAKLRLPEYASIITLGNLAIALVLVAIMAAVSSYIAVRKVLRVEPFEVFRG